jgi:hypothetical protein
MTVLEWCDPPPANRGRWQRLADELSARPGEWAKVIERDTEIFVQTAKRGLQRAGCETRSHWQGSEVSLWARWPETT